MTQISLLRSTRRVCSPSGRRMAAAILTVLFLSPAVLAESGASAEPSLVISPDPLELGVVPADAIRELEFELRNEGRETLRLEGVTILTNDLRVTEVTKEIPPGEAGVLRAEMVFRGGTGPGKLEIRLETNEPENPFHAAVAQVEVREYVKVHPPKAWWSVVRFEKDGTISFTLTSADEGSFEIVEVDVPRDGLESRFEPLSSEEGSAHQQWALDLTLDDRAPVGPIEGEVVVRLKGSEQRTVRIPISGVVRPQLWVSPPALEFEEVSIGDEPKSQRLIVKNHGTEPVEVLEARHDLPGLPGPRVEELEPGRVYGVDLEFPPTLAPGRLSGSVTIFTDSDDVPHLVVPVDGVIAPPRTTDDP